jgi:hypothetical protein
MPNPLLNAKAQNPNSGFSTQQIVNQGMSNVPNVANPGQPSSVKMSEYWNRYSSPAGSGGTDTKMLSKTLTDLGLREFGQTMGTTSSEQMAKYAQMSDDMAMQERSKELGSVVKSAEHKNSGFSAEIELQKSLGDMFDAADKFGYTTSDQFRTGFDNLIGSSPRAKKFLNDPLVRRNYLEGSNTNLKDVSAELFGRMVRARQADIAAGRLAPNTGTLPAQQPPASQSETKTQPAKIRVVGKKVEE